MRAIRNIVLGLSMLWTGQTLAQAPHTRAVQVTIRITNAANEPMIGLPISCTTRAAKSYAATASDGQATLSVDVQDGERLMCFMVSPKNAPDESESLRGSDRNAEVSGMWALPKPFLVPLAGKEAVYHKELVLAAGRRVKMRRLDSTGAPLDGFFVATPDTPLRTFHRDGTHDSAGVSTAACVLYSLEVSSVVMQPVPVPATDGDLDLGDVVLPLPTTDATLHLTFTNFKGADERLGDSGIRAFAVSVDGQTLLELFLRKGKTVRNYTSDEPSQVPSGEYWICPTSIISGVTAQTLLELVRSGADLSTSGIPKITIPAGGAVEQTIDAAAAQHAILQAGGIDPG